MNKKQHKLDAIRIALNKRGYEASEGAQGLHVVGHDLVGIGRVAGAIAKCTVTAIGGNTLVVLR